MNWIVYILKCGDGTLYTGVTNDLESRIKKHESGRGAKYTRGRAPYKILFQEEFPSKGLALKREREIKMWDRPKKLQFIAGAR